MDHADTHAIRLLRGGQIAGLEPLVRRYQRPALRAALTIVRDYATAEDVVQAAFVRVYDRIHQFDLRKPFAPWFFRIVLNDALKAAQRRDRDLSLSAEDGTAMSALVLPDGGLRPDQCLEQTETFAELWAALESLPPQQRVVLVQRYVLEMREDAMSDALDVPRGTIKSRLHAARQHLRRRLASVLSDSAQETTP